MAPIEYDKRNFDTVSTYTDKGFLDAIHNATGLSDRKDTAVVVDLMSGPGKVAFGMQERAPQHSYAVLDYNERELDGIKQPVRKILGDVTKLSAVIDNESVDVATVRYGLKDIPQDQQVGVLVGINRALKPGGTLVIVDMISPEGMEEWTNMQHSRKQQFGGRDIKKEGECHIPTEQGWLEFLQESGFKPEVVGYYTSSVSTENWRTGNQLGDSKGTESFKNRAIMETILMGAPDEVRKQFNIRREGELVKIEYPVAIIRAVKKEVKPGLPATGICI